MYIGTVSNVRQTLIRTAEPLVTEPSVFKVETDTEKLKRHKSAGSDQIPAEFIKAEGSIIWSEIHKLINSIWNKEELPQQWKKSINLHIYKKDGKTEYTNRRTRTNQHEPRDTGQYFNVKSHYKHNNTHTVLHIHVVGQRFKNFLYILNIIDTF